MEDWWQRSEPGSVRRRRAQGRHVEGRAATAGWQASAASRAGPNAMRFRSASRSELLDPSRGQAVMRARNDTRPGAGFRGGTSLFGFDSASSPMSSTISGGGLCFGRAVSEPAPSSTPSSAPDGASIDHSLGTADPSSSSNGFPSSPIPMGRSRSDDDGGRGAGSAAPRPGSFDASSFAPRLSFGTSASTARPRRSPPAPARTRRASAPSTQPPPRCAEVHGHGRAFAWRELRRRDRLRHPDARGLEHLRGRLHRARFPRG